MHRFTPKEIRFLEKKVTGRSFVELTKLFNRHFTLSLTLMQIRNACLFRRLCNGLDGRIRPGHISPNKGKKGYHPGILFQLGHKAWCRLPIGTERINDRGYVKVKIRNPMTWKSKHIILWEEAHGKVPKGHTIIFADRNKLNMDLDNLLLVSKRELGVMNIFGLITADKDLTKVGKSIADIKIAIADRNQGTKKRKKSRPMKKQQPGFSYKGKEK